MWILGALLACGAVGPSVTEAPKTAPVRPTPEPKAVRPSDPDNPLTPALQRIFDDARCLGPFASVQVFRDAEGEVQRLYYSGSPAMCSHPPSVYYDADGALLETVAMEPLTDENRAFFADLHARHRGDLVAAERITFDK